MRRLLVAVLLLVGTGPLWGQDRPDTAAVPDSLHHATTRQLEGERLRAMPVDRVTDAVRLLPGATSGVTGPVSVRGGRPADLGTELDGIPVDPGVRGTASTSLTRAFQDFAGQRELLGSGGVGRLGLVTGPGGVGHAGGGSGLLSYATPDGGERWRARFDARTDGLWGREHSQGYNRLEAAAGGAFGSFRLSAAGTLEGAKSVATAPGAGDAPIFAASGIGGTVAVPALPGDPTSDTSYVDILDFTAAPATRLPASTNSVAQAQVKLSWLGTATRVFASAVLAEDQARHFDYVNLYNAQQLGAGRTSSRLLSLGATHRLGRTRPVLLEAFLSFQRDLGEDGPLTTDGDLDSRDPFGGFLLAPLDLRFGFEEFPVDAELVENYRRNTPGSRRSPYDLENTNQYSLIDQWRNNAYGVLGFSESGGPVGRLTLLDEERTVVGGRVGFGLAGTRMRIGAEGTAWDLAGYAHALTSQVASDVWIESPSATALWVEDEMPLGPHGSVVAGLRYERFASGARRPWLREDDPASPEFGRSGWFPRVSTYGYDGTDWDPDLIEFREDASHAAVGGSVRIAYAASSRLALRGGFGRYPRRPDFQLVYLGVNTDISLSTSAQSWGSDLDFESVTHGEVGARYDLGAGVTLDGAAWLRNVDDEIRTVTVSEYDPGINRTRDLAVLSNTTDGTSGLGVDLVVERRVGALSGWAGWSWQDVTAEVAGFDGPRERPAPESRPHTLYLAALAVTPAGWQEGSIVGALADGGSLALAYRRASGTPYRRCTNVQQNADVLSGMNCLAVPHDGVSDARTPSISTLDLRLAKAIPLRGTTLSLFLDARNLLGTENVLRVFSATGETESEQAAAVAWRGDSADFAQEALRNGLYRPDQSIDLTFDGAPDPLTACGGWVDGSASAAAPNCVYLVGAEGRFGDGDRIFTLEEQRRASDAFYRTTSGRPTLLGPGRRLRVGLSLAI
jgi:hypothetical protein